MVQMLTALNCTSASVPRNETVVLRFRYICFSATGVLLFEFGFFDADISLHLQHSDSEGTSHGCGRQTICRPIRDDPDVQIHKGRVEGTGL